MICDSCELPIAEYADEHTFSGYGFYVRYHPWCCPRSVDGTDCDKPHASERLARLQKMAERQGERAQLRADLARYIDGIDFRPGDDRCIRIVCFDCKPAVMKEFQSKHVMRHWVLGHFDQSHHDTLTFGGKWH